MSETPALKIQGLYRNYGKTKAVDGLDLEIPEGEIFGLLGPNGAGKSTSIHCITGVTAFDTGKIEIFGRDVRREPTWTRRHVGMMHQEVYPDNFFEIGRALKIHVGYYGYPDDPEWRNLLVERLGLTPHLEKKMMQLSGGLKRRFALAKALIHKPRLLILDEPTAGVDVELRITIWNFVREINQKGTTVLLTTHYLEEAEKMCGRIGIMNGGRLVALDTSRNLAAKIQDRELVIVPERPLQKWDPILDQMGARILPDGSLQFPLKREQSVGPILDELRKIPLVIRDVAMKTSSLEDVFLKLTGSAMGAKP
jgi:ABC-2 type transport system ATP-binding protein